MLEELGKEESSPNTVLELLELAEVETSSVRVCPAGSSSGAWVSIGPSSKLVPLDTERYSFVSSKLVLETSTTDSLKLVLETSKISREDVP